MGLGFKALYSFCSEKVNEVSGGSDFFNTHIKPMAAWHPIDVVSVSEHSGHVVVRVGGVRVSFERGASGVWVAWLSFVGFESRDFVDQQINYIDRFCCVIDGYRRNDAGELEKIAG